MLHHLSGVAGVLYRRAADETPAYQLPNWALLVLIANVIVFFPILLFIGYTLNQVYPVLAMVEDENPPAYEPLSLQDPGPDDDAATRKPPSATGRGEDGAPRAVTSSLRAMNRLLHSTAGWRANFRGLSCLFVQGLASTLLSGIFMVAFPRFFSPLADLLATLALLPLSTAWVHIIISTPQPRSWRHRLPPFRRAFDAVARPAAAFWLANEVSMWSVYFLSAALGLELSGDHRDGVKLRRPSAGASGRVVIVLAVALALQVLLVIPAQVVLVRVQASLLPPEEDTIIPFDRSFEGRVEPALVGGKGYVSMRDAWATFSRGAWKRLVVLYVKIFFTTMALFGLMAAVIVPEVILMAAKSG